MNDHRAVFYEVDLAEVIENRRSLLGEHPNEVLIGGDIFTLDWIQAINNSLPSLLIASGIFQYYHEEKIIGFIHDLQRAFPGGELIFDATNAKGITYASNYVKKTGNTSAPMYFFVNDGAKFAQKSGTTLINCLSFFMDARKMLAKRLKIYTRIAMKIVDMSGRAILVHLKL